MENRGFIHIIERKAQHLGNNNNKHTLSTYYMSAAIQELYMYLFTYNLYNNTKY